MLFDTVYECDLYSITPEIRVNQDWNRRKNISEADTKIVSKIMVQRTINPNFYKEIITGMLIPAYRTIFKSGAFHSWGGDIYYRVPKEPVFIKFEERHFYDNHWNSLVVAQAVDVKKYIEEHASNVEKFKNELTNLFKTAEEYYEDAYLKNTYSNKKTVKSLIKTIKK